MISHQHKFLLTGGQIFQHGGYFFGILQTGTKLPMHLIVQEINRNLELLENNTSLYVDLIDRNGNILIQHVEIFPNLARGFL